MSKEKANERINSRSVKATERKSHTGLVIILSVVVVCALLGIIIYLIMGKEEAKTSYNRIVTPDNVDEIVSQLAEEERTPVGAYEVSMNTEWIFEDGESASANAYVENGINNQNIVYFTITLVDDAEGGDIYRSPYLEIGSSLRDIKLDKDLDPGTYSAIITYHLVDDDLEDLSSVSLYMTITVNN